MTDLTAGRREGPRFQVRWNIIAHAWMAPKTMKFQPAPCQKPIVTITTMVLK